jgi:uncharacterized protein (TIGR02646 family)
MIRRKAPPAPEKLPAAALDELQRLQAKLARGEKLGTGDFKAYKTSGIREALNACFRFKCAYCESFYGATGPVAIEHFRPKAKVTTEQGDRPGYYWLAAKWPNLLPSCTDCNSPRKQEMAGRLVTVGKGNQFPIANEARRAQGEDEERSEDRLLLHPYLDRPECHLEFAEEGIVRARRTSGRESRKGSVSIAVYALQRPILVDARLVRQSEIRGVMDVVEREARRHDLDPGDAGQTQILEDEVARLRRFCADDAPYSEMARQMIEPFMERLLR